MICDKLEELLESKNLVVRDGKIKKIPESNPGYKTIDGHKERMSIEERQQRKKAAIKSGRKSKAKSELAKRKRQQSLDIRDKSIDKGK